MRWVSAVLIGAFSIASFVFLTLLAIIVTGIARLIHRIWR